MNNKPNPGNFKTTRSRAELSAITLMEIIMDLFPDIARSEGSYHQALYRLTDYLHERDRELETDLTQQLTPND